MAEVNKQDFLTEYLKDKKPSSFFAKPGLFRETQICINDTFKVIFYESYYGLFCVIDIIGKHTRASFEVPSTYQEFKTLMDIFLKGCV